MPIKKRICLVIPSLQAGGMERVMAELSGHFTRKKAVELHLILYGIKRDIFYTIPDSVIVHKPEFGFNNRIRALSSIRTLYFLRKKVKSISPDTILSFGEYWNSFVLLALIGLSFPVFVSDRSQPDKSLGRLHDWLRKWLYPLAAGVIAQTHAAKNIYQTMYRHKNIRVIGNPIRTIQKESIQRENSVLMVGRLIRSKNQDKLIQLFSKINIPEWKLVLVGYDHMKQENMIKLQQLVKELKMEDRVVLTGKQADVDEYYLRSKIFAFTSTSEGFPNVIGEAMSAGLPVVTFDCMAGPADMIEDGENGFLIPVNEYKFFQQKLELLMRNENLREQFGEHGKNTIQQFSIDAVGEQYFNFITN